MKEALLQLKVTKESLNGNLVNKIPDILCNNGSSETFKRKKTKASNASL